MARKIAQKVTCILLVLYLLTAQVPVQAADGEPFTLLQTSVGYSHNIESIERYINWAGVSTVSQFADDEGNYCFAVNEGDQILIFKTKYGKVAEKVTIPTSYDAFGAATCDEEGNLYIVWGKNGSNDVYEQTIFVTKYTADGQRIATIGGNGSEGMPSYYQSSFYTKIPFDYGNCDVAINGDLLLVNYARTMYSGHQANTVFPVNIKTMEVEIGIDTYNSHSLDQRITPYSKTGGFLLASQGDCFPRSFTTSLTNARRTQNEMDTFNFWVEENAYDDYDMWKLNKTYARLGNILETPYGAALVGSSARSLSQNAQNEPYDVFVQVFDPTGRAKNPNSYVTTGKRTGVAGNNGNTTVTDYGVQWVTALGETGKTADVVQAVSVENGKIAVLYELYNKRTDSFDSTWYTLLDGDGTVLQEPEKLGNVRLNVDEDPVYAQGAVQWTANKGSELVIYSLFPNLPESNTAWEGWRKEMFYISDPSASYAGGSLTVRAAVHTDGITKTTVCCGFYNAKEKLVDVQLVTISGRTEDQVQFRTRKSGVAEARIFLLDDFIPMSKKIDIPLPQ